MRCGTISRQKCIWRRCNWTDSCFSKGQQQVKRIKVQDTEAEKKRYREAVQTAITELQGLYDKALKEVGEANAAIFEMHQMMLEDEDFTESVENIIDSQSVNAEYAVASTGDNFAQMFASMDDEYMRGRAADVKDISERLVSVLNGASRQQMDADEPVIVMAVDLAPSETVQMDKDKVLSFVTTQGSVNSHTAILARTMSIPALIGVDMPLDAELRANLPLLMVITERFILIQVKTCLHRCRKRRSRRRKRSSFTAA